MPVRHHTKNITLLTVLIVILVVVILLIHKKAPATTRNPLEATPSETSSVLEIKKQTPDAFDAHMALTSTNIIWFTNYYRRQEGLKPLIFSKKLQDSAYHKSLDMFKYQYFSHYRPSNHLGFDNFIDNQKYDFIKIGENLAQGDFTTSKEIVDSWMQSPDHRQNILDATYTEIGVSVDYGIMNGERSVLITQHLGKPKTTCPVVNEKLYAKISSMTKQLIGLKKSIDADQGNVNESITQYNNILKDREVLVNEYNDQVNAFDACVSRG